jgi:hypothetical protein
MKNLATLAWIWETIFSEPKFKQKVKNDFFFSFVQGDQIGRIFAHLTVVYFGHF